MMFIGSFFFTVLVANFVHAVKNTVSQSEAVISFSVVSVLKCTQSSSSRSFNMFQHQYFSFITFQYCNGE